MPLPPDDHVHSEWSWDTSVGDMEQSCVRAVDLGLPSIAFTEHLDHTVWRIALEGPYVMDNLTAFADSDGMLTPPAFDALGYLTAIERCRERFPDLRILSGLEIGEPHRHRDHIAQMLAAGRFDRLLGSLHTLPDEGTFAEPWGIYPHRDPYDVVRAYLAEVSSMVSTSDVFAVLAHIDYPVRSWPSETAGPFDLAAFEDEFRHALHETAQAGRALEVNTRLPLHAAILTWWHEVGGEAITFGSDAHLPSFVGHGLTEAAHMAEAHGFRPGKDPFEMWRRVD